MACSTAHVEEEAGQRGFAERAAARARRASSSATSAASRSAASASSRVRSSAAGARSSASATPRSRRPESISFPAGQEGRRRADLARRRRPCAADPASDADDRRPGQPLLRLCGDQPHRVPPGQAARGQRRGPSGRSSAPCPRSLARGCARSPIRSFACAWSRLPRKLPLAAARRRSRPRTTSRYPRSTGANER